MLEQLKTVLSCLPQPAFILEAGHIIYRNEAAQRAGLECLPEEIHAQLQSANEQILACAGNQWTATIRQLAQYQLVLLQAQTAPQNDQMLSAAARALRRPLQKMFLAASQLFPYLEDQEDTRIQAGTASLNRSMYQMLRTVSNLTELSQATPMRCRKLRTECNAFFEALFQRARPLLESTGRTLTYQCPQKRFYADMDSTAIERAVLNLLSNAITHTPRGEAIAIQITKDGSFCRICVKNDAVPPEIGTLENFFQRYTREGDFGQSGAGFGLSIAQNVARAHNGTVLAQLGNPDGLCVVMTIEVTARSWGDTTVRSPQVYLDSFGGHDPFLIELSDVLPDSQFDTRKR